MESTRLRPRRNEALTSHLAPGEPANERRERDADQEDEPGGPPGELPPDAPKLNRPTVGSRHADHRDHANPDRTEDVQSQGNPRAGHLLPLRPSRVHGVGETADCY